MTFHFWSKLQLKDSNTNFLKVETLHPQYCKMRLFSDFQTHRDLVYGIHFWIGYIRYAFAAFASATGFIMQALES